MAETKFGFQIGSALASDHLTDSKYIQGTYHVVKDTTERDALKIKTDTDDGVIVKGSLVYVQSESKLYIFDGTNYTEFETGGSSGIKITDTLNLTMLPGLYIYDTETPDPGYEVGGIYEITTTPEIVLVNSPNGAHIKVETGLGLTADEISDKFKVTRTMTISDVYRKESPVTEDEFVGTATADEPVNHVLNYAKIKIPAFINMDDIKSVKLHAEVSGLEPGKAGEGATFIEDCEIIEHIGYDSSVGEYYTVGKVLCSVLVPGLEEYARIGLSKFKDNEIILYSDYYSSRLNVFPTVIVYEEEVTYASNRIRLNIEQTDDKAYGFNPDKNEWEEVSGSDSSTTEEITVQLGDDHVGNFATGHIIAEGTTLTEVLKDMLVKRIAPTYTAPKVTIAASSALIEKDVDTDVTYTITFTKNDAGDLTEIGGEDITAGTTSPYEVTKTLSETYEQTCYAKYAEGPIKKDNLGEDYPTGHIEAGEVDSKVTVTAIYPFYYGVSNSNTVDAAFVKAGTKDLSKKGDKKYTYTANNQYLWFAYNSTYGNVTHIIDPNNFENLSDFETKTVTVGNATYKVYITTGDSAKKTCSNFTYTIKF